MLLMKNLFLFLVFSFGLINIECKTDVADANSIAGYVVGIADGDTFTLLTKSKQQVKIRLYGIDCPEKKQDFGQVAKQKLSALIFNTNVTAKKINIDRYGRTVAIVYDASKNCINEELLRTGLAWHYKKYDNNPAWEKLQNDARKNKSGLWSQPNPVAPWDYRMMKKATHHEKQS